MVLHDLAFVAGTVALFLHKVRYTFEGNDHQQYLLLPYREIYPNFLPGDWFTWQTTHYHVTFAWLVRGIHFVTGEQGFAVGMLVAHGLVLAGLGAGLLALARALDFGRFAAWLALLVTVFVRGHALGGAVVTHGVLLPADAALPPFLLACAAWIAGRPLATGLCLGAAGFLHANYAALGPVLLGGLELYRGPLDRTLIRRVLWMAGGYLVLAWPSLWVIVQSFLLPDAAPAQTALFFEVRSPHHYDLARFAARDLWWMLSLLGLATPVLLQRGAPGAGALRAMSVAIIALLLFGLLGAKLQLLSIVRIFVWRMSVLLALLWLLAIGACLRDAARGRRSRLLLLPLAAGLLWLASFTVPPELPWAERPAAVLAQWGRFVWPHARNPPGGHLGELYSWVRRKSPSTASFLVPPGLIDFRLQARRAIFVDWKCTPMRGDELLEWKRRMLAAMGTSDFPSVGYALRHDSSRAYERRPVKALADLARAEGLTYVITRRPPNHARGAGLRHVRRFGPWHVYAVRSG